MWDYSTVNKFSVVIRTCCFSSIPCFLSKFELSGQNTCGGLLKWFELAGVSRYLGFELSGSKCIENSTPKPRRMEIWFKLAGVRVTEVILWF